MEAGESLELALQRELHEEIGVQVVTHKIVGRTQLISRGSIYQ